MSVKERVQWLAVASVLGVLAVVENFGVNYMYIDPSTGSGQAGRRAWRLRLRLQSRRRFLPDSTGPSWPFVIDPARLKQLEDLGAACINS